MQSYAVFEAYFFSFKDKFISRRLLPPLKRSPSLREGGNTVRLLYTHNTVGASTARPSFKL